MRESEKGFTLVELSIVLVIIGLLIGGILAAQSMISTAKVQSFVKQMQQYDIALTNHMTRYNSWPGDDDLYATAVHNAPSSVKGDGQITDDNNFNDTWGDDEEWYYFPELNVLDGLTIENCPTIGPNALLPIPGLVIPSGPTCNVPLGKLGKNNTIFAFSNQLGSPSYPGNYYFFVDCTGMYDATFDHIAGGGCTTPFTGVEALAYDSKIDDGIANTGNVLGFYNSQIGFLHFIPSGTSSYNTTTSGLTYYMVEKIAPNMQQ